MFVSREIGCCPLSVYVPLCELSWVPFLCGQIIQTNKQLNKQPNKQTNKQTKECCFTNYFFQNHHSSKRDALMMLLQQYGVCVCVVKDFYRYIMGRFWRLLSTTAFVFPHINIPPSLMFGKTKSNITSNKFIIGAHYYYFIECTKDNSVIHNLCTLFTSRVMFTGELQKLAIHMLCWIWDNPEVLNLN